MKKYFLLMLVTASLSARIYAQVPLDEARPVETPPIETPPEPVVVFPEEVFDPDVIRETTYEPSPVTVTYSPSVFEELRTNSLPGSFAQTEAWSLQNNFGFSLGLQEGYYFSENSDGNADNFSGLGGKQSSSATSLSANVFTNYASGKSAIHLDYGADYIFYPQRQNSADDINHSVSAAYIYKINDRARFQLREYLTSSSNDPLSDSFSINTSSDRYLTGSYFYDAVLTPQRYTRNTVTANLSSDITGRGTNVTVFGSYENYWYGEHAGTAVTLEDYYSATVGGGINQRITNWLSLGTSYSIQLNDDLENHQTHRIEIGRLQFNLSPNTTVYAAGGVAITNTGVTEQGYKVSTLARAGISYSTQIAGKLYADYSRTMTSVSGFRRMLPSDTVSVGLGKPIGRKTNIRLLGYYQRSSDYSDSGHLYLYQGQASVEYLLVSGLALSANYTYRYQKNSIVSLNDFPYFERSTVSVGLRYTWPSGRIG